MSDINQPQKSVRQKLPRAFIIVGLIVGVLGVDMYVTGLLNRPTVTTQADQPPDTAKPDQAQINNHQVPADQPRYLTIPRLGSTSRVVALGATKQNAIAAPTNIHDVGWFHKSSKPGQGGAMVFDGHITRDSSRGVFYGLKELTRGDVVTVERGDGAVFRYIVIATATYDHDKVDMAKVLNPIEPGQPGLNLITCAGEVMDGTTQFSKRLVVFTSQVK